jgi:hypothetical protein
MPAILTHFGKPVVAVVVTWTARNGQTITREFPPQAVHHAAVLMTSLILDYGLSSRKTFRYADHV